MVEKLKIQREKLPQLRVVVNNMNIKILIKTLLIFLLGFSSMTTFAANANENNWIKSPLNVYQFYANQISNENFIELSDEFQLEAQSLLAEKTYIKIDINRANQYTIKNEILIQKNNFYLVRGVKTSDGGVFSMYQYKHKLLVTHGDLGKPKKLVLKRTVLLVSLKKTVSEAFADYSLAE
jgi:hypothetical protein